MNPILRFWICDQISNEQAKAPGNILWKLCVCCARDLTSGKIRWKDCRYLEFVCKVLANFDEISFCGIRCFKYYLFAFRGVILFAMLNGRLPYNDRDIRTLIEQTKVKPRFSSRVQVTTGKPLLFCQFL